MVYSIGGAAHAHIGRAIVIGMAIIVGACAGPSRGLLVPTGKQANGGRSVTLLAMTTRSAAPEEPQGYMYSGEREAAGRLNYAVLTLSLPPGRKSGDLPVDADRHDPDKHVTLV